MSRYRNVKPLVLVIGESLVFGLKQFVAFVLFCPWTSGFAAWDCRVNFAGKRGGTTRSLSTHSEFSQILHRQLPRVAVLSMGTRRRRSRRECS